MICPTIYFLLYRKYHQSGGPLTRIWLSGPLPERKNSRRNTLYALRTAGLLSRFRCLADTCPDTCCAGWQISIDPKSLKRYRAYRGDFRPRLLKGIRWNKKVFRQDSHGRCVFLDKKNLCGMYLHMGRDTMCRTCRLYPRHIEEFENVREVSLSLSCPEAARLLLEGEAPVRFLEFNRPGRLEAYQNFDQLLYSQLYTARQRMTGILQNRSLSLSLRFGLISWLADEMEKKWKRGSLSTWEELLEKTESGFRRS